MEIPLLKDIVIIFGLSIGVLLLCHWIRLPLIVGFLITGILAGPHGLKLVKAASEVQILAEVGIIVLLFTVGLEVSFKKILENKRYFFLGGLLQVLLTTLGGFSIAMAFGRPLGEAVFLGFLISLSSTAIVMKLLQDNGETNTPHGKLTLGILIFQDIMAVPMILITPYLAGETHLLEVNQLYFIIAGLLLLTLTFFAAMWFVPRLLFYVAKTRSHELFLLTILMICFSVAWMASSVGLSLALGAFLAGLIIAESEYSHQAIGDIIPFRDIFTSFFFVSIGMLLDIDFFFTYPIQILILTVGVLALKFFIALATTLLLGMPIRTAVMTGCCLSQVGEFSFVLATFGFAAGLGNNLLNQLFLSVAILTMGTTPFMMMLSSPLMNLFFKIPLPKRLSSGLKSQPSTPENKLENHIVIIGFGVSGRNLARSAKEAGVPYVIIDLNPETVRIERRRGEPIHFGDASREHVLHHIQAHKASVIAILVNDPVASLRIVEKSRKINESAYIIVRTQFLQQMQMMFHLGADDVISDEFGSSVEIFTRVLQHYKAPQEKIEKLIAELRAEGYEMLRHRYIETTIFSNIKEPVMDVTSNTFIVGKDSPLAGKTIKENEIRTKYGLTILLIRRKNITIYNIDPEMTLQVGDIVVVIGKNEDVLMAKELFQ